MRSRSAGPEAIGAEVSGWMGGFAKALELARQSVEEAKDVIVKQLDVELCVDDEWKR